jgi:hypothetical protein
MALNAQLTDRAANVMIDAQTVLLDGGFLDLYDGVQPLTGDTPVTTQLRLASLTFGSPAFAAGVGGVAVAHLIAGDPDAAANGDATWYRCYQADHVTSVCDGSVGLSDSNIVIVPSVTIQIHARVDISSFALAVNKSSFLLGR